ncbi:unnamed protein product, partial [Prorocentrum cordatum]
MPARAPLALAALLAACCPHAPRGAAAGGAVAVEVAAHRQADSSRSLLEGLERQSSDAQLAQLVQDMPQRLQKVIGALRVLTRDDSADGDPASHLEEVSSGASTNASALE